MSRCPDWHWLSGLRRLASTPGWEPPGHPRCGKPASVTIEGSHRVSSIALPAESGATTRALELATLLALGAIASVATVGLLVHSPVLVSPTWTAIVRALYVAA